MDKDKLHLEYEDQKDERDHQLEIEKLKKQTPHSESPNVDGERKTSSEDVRFDYLNWVRTQVSELSLQGIDPEATQDEHEGKLHLDQVYTALLTTDSKTGDKVNNPEQLGREDKRLSAWHS